MDWKLKTLLSAVVLCGLVPLAQSNTSTGIVPSHPDSQLPVLVSPLPSTYGVFQEPLLPFRTATPPEQLALDVAIARYHQSADPAKIDALKHYLDAQPDSPWRVSLLLNMAMAKTRAGYFTDAMALFAQAHEAGKVADSQAEQAVTLRALGELLSLHTRFGHEGDIARLLKDVPESTAAASISEDIAEAQSGLWQIQHIPEETLRCGLESLATLLAHDRHIDPTALREIKAGKQGTSLAELAQIANDKNQLAVAVQRTVGQPVPVPSVMHLSQGHFATVLSEKDGRYEIYDPAYGEQLWMSKGALEAESSGNFLVLGEAAQTHTALPWALLDHDAAAKVVGAGNTIQNQNQQTSSCDITNGGSGGESGIGKGCGTSKNPTTISLDGPPVVGLAMPIYRVHAMLVSLNIVDTPLGYQPPVGPGVFATLSYSQREAQEPTTYTYGNLGHKWLFNWSSYIEDDPQQAGSRVRIYLRGGGTRDSGGYNNSTGAFASDQRTGAILTRVSGNPIQYERVMANGAKHIYAESDGSSFYPRRIFLTKVIDATGNAVELSYDNQHRLVSLTDALGQITQIHYDQAANPLLMTGITDPFGRMAQFGYDASGRLSSITDAQGMTSSFTYGSGTQITAMTTPYGTTSFAAGQSGTTRWVQITDPKGERERVEYRHGASGIPFSDSPVPSGMNLFNQYISSRNTFYWDKEAMKRAPGNYTQARIQHWFHLRTNGSVTTGVLESVKNPLERRVWFNYPGQGWAGAEGTLDKPSIIGRVLPDGTTQLKKFNYNNQGNITAEIDPQGRETRYDYAANGIDVTRITRKTASGFETLAEFTYNDQHRPLTYTDPDGQVTSYSYTPAGQLLSVTNPLGQTSTFSYDGQGYLEGITDANGVRQVSYTYDLIGRKASETNAAGYRLEYSYDNLNRLVEIRYPDGTADSYTWDKLDMVNITDRHGNTTQHSYDEVRNRMGTEDASGHVTDYDYFANGDLKSTTDGNGNTTTLERDIQSRVVKTIRPDSQFSQITYDNNGRQTTITDPLNGVTQFSYAKDDKLASVTDPKGSKTLYAYHPYTGQLTEQNSPDTGKTTYEYDTDGNLIRKQDANGNLAEMDYDAINRAVTVQYSDGQTVTYGYDSGPYGKGRLTDIAEDAATTTLAYDNRGNVSQRTQTGADGNPLTVQYRYTSAGNLEQVIYPSGAVVDYGYQRDRLVSIAVNGQTLLDNIEYEPFGPIQGWQWGNGQSHTRSYDAAGLLASLSLANDTRTLAYTNVNNIKKLSDSQLEQNFVYDFLDRLTTAQATGATTDQSYNLSYGYDANGNRTTENDNGTATSYSIQSDTNRLTSVNGENRTLDDNGNLIDDGTHSYQYDTRNRLVSVDNGNTAQYRYNALGQSIYKQGLERYQLTVDLNGDGQITNDDIHVLDDLIKANQHPGYADLTQDGVVDKKYNACIATLIGKNDKKKAVPPRCHTGEWVETATEVNFVYEGPSLLGEYNLNAQAKQEIIWLGNIPVALLKNNELIHIHADHLGTPVAITDNDNSVVWRWDRRPFGDSLSDEDPDNDGQTFTFNLRFPGQYFDRQTNLHYNHFRDYDPRTGRYVQPDPIGLNGGLNTLAYVQSNPLLLTDSLGLFPSCRLVDGGPGFADYFICDNGGPDYNSGDASALPESTNNQCTLDCIGESSNEMVTVACGSLDAAVSLLSRSNTAGTAVGGACLAVLSTMSCTLDCNDDDCE